MGTIGPRLRAAREARNLSVEQAADDTRIALRFLQALEREEFDALPAPVYVRGFLRSYANYLGLEPQSLLSELEGEVAGPAAFVRGPSNGNGRPAARTATDPFRPRPATLPAPAGEWDPEPDVPPPPPAPYIEPVREREYRPRTVPGVLTERGYTGPPSRLPAIVLVGGIGAIVVLVALIAVVAVGGDGEPTLPAGADDDAESTPTAGAGQTIVVVETPTTTATAGGGEATGTAAAGETPAGDATATPAGTGATVTPGAQPTASITPTATATSPPTATPTFTPEPTPTATVQPHPFGTSECTAGGGTNCGDPPFRVICAPDGWFVDKDRDYPKPPDWFEFDVNMTFGIDSVAEATCG
jgi:cytoskeleton protein RodZ